MHHLYPRIVISILNLRSRPIVLVALLLVLSAPAVAAENATEIESRLTDAVGYLASDELEGRGVGTKGLDKAAEYIATQFAEIGLAVELFDGSAFQKFTITTNAKMGAAKENRLALVGPDGARDEGEGKDAGEGKDKTNATKRSLKLGKDFNPLAAGGSSEFDLPMVFAGYGISSEEAEYDDYAGLDVKDKCVVILRHQPDRGNPHSKFGKDPSRHAYFDTKISNAYQRGAAAILFLTGQHELDTQLAGIQRRWQAAVDALVEANKTFKEIAEPTDKQLDEHRQKITRLAEQIKRFSSQRDEQRDPVLSFHRAGSGGGGREMPIFHCRRAVIDQVVKAALGKDLATLEAEIDKDLKPRSAPLAGWRATGKTLIERQQADVKNVVAVLEGQGPHAEETIVIGAHYDHLGYGGPGSADPNSKKIHNGADDNGSGVATLLEIARRLTSLGKKLPRRVVFIAFTGEERGLLGSAHYVKNPLVPLDKTIAMLNLDMVGRLKDNKLIVHGTGTAEEFDMLVKRLNAQHQFELIKKPSGFGPSDHTSFYEKKIPVMHFFTGAHQDYHRPSDDSDKLNVAGMRRVGALIADMAVAVAEAEAPPKYLATKRSAVAGGKWPYFGSRPDYAYEKPGVRMAGVAPDSPAERGGIKEGDVIVRFGKAKLATVADFANVLSKHKAGDKVEIAVMRDGKEVKLTVTLDPPRR